jgi:branched-chain amino acid transport system substrate-binding protein
MAQKLACVVAIAIVATACTKKAPVGDVIKVGEVGSMTGNEASFGTSTHNGVELAIQQINAAGGIKGKKVEDIALDDQGKPEEAATAVTKLITEDGVSAILGEVASSRSLAMAPIAQRYKIPMISPTSTNPKVTETGDYIFRACFIDPFQGTVMAKFASDNLKMKKVAILRDVKNDYSVGLANFFIETFKKSGGEIVIDQSYSAGDIDFKSQLTSIRAQNPDGIYVPGYYTEVGLIARQARELGITVPLMGGDGWDSPKLKEIGGKALNNSYLSNHYSTDSTAPETQEFVTKYKAAYGTLPDSMAALGYDATRLLADAMNRAKSLSPDDVRQAILETKNFPGAAGKITMDANRNPTKSAVILKVVDGDLKYVATINP